VEDYALACGLVGFAVISPADEVAARALVFRAAEHVGPVYMRMGRAKVPIIYAAGDDDFQIGKARTLLEGSDVALIGCGIMVAECIRAAETLAGEGVSAMVVDMHTLKPLDTAAVAAACQTGAIVTAEEHLLDGGLGSQVARASAAISPVPMEFVGIQDTYAESGTPEEILAKYGLTAPNVVAAARRVLKRKRA
jgi:transketolase